MGTAGMQLEILQSDTLRLGTAKLLCGYALQGYSAVWYCQNTAAGHWDAVGYLAVRYPAVVHCRDWTLQGALQGYSAAKHCTTCEENID